MMMMIVNEEVTPGTGPSFCSAGEYRPADPASTVQVLFKKRVVPFDTCAPFHTEVAVKLCQNAPIADCMSICRTYK